MKKELSATTRRVRTTATGCRYVLAEVPTRDSEDEKQLKTSPHLRVAPPLENRRASTPIGESLRVLLEPFKQDRRRNALQTPDDDFPSAA